MQESMRRNNVDGFDKQEAFAARQRDQLLEHVNAGDAKISSPDTQFGSFLASHLLHWAARYSRFYRGESIFYGPRRFHKSRT